MQMLNRLSALAGLFIVVTVCFSLQANAQGSNDNAQFSLDFVTDQNDSQASTTFEAEPVFEAVDGSQRFSCTLVVQGAVDLTGLSVDIRFNNAVLQLVDIYESRGDRNFDGRANVADVLAIGERFGLTIGPNPELAYFDLDSTADSAGLIDVSDVNALLPFVNQDSLYWTFNSNATGFETFRESVEVFEDPAQSNTDGLIDDLAVVLLRRPETPVEGFGFTGDARVATLIFEVIGGTAGSTTPIQFEDPILLDEGTVINDDGSLQNESRPESPEVIITLP